jgi:hypothetical protein
MLNNLSDLKNESITFLEVKEQSVPEMKCVKRTKVLTCSIDSTGHIFGLNLHVQGFGIATGYRLDNQGRSLSPGRVKNFLFSTSPRLALVPTQPPIQWIPVALSSGTK